MPNTDIKKILDDYSSSALTQMATFHGVLPKQSKTKAALIDALSKTVTDPERIRRQLGELSRGERAVLDGVLRRDGSASVRNLRAELTSLHLIDPQAPVSFGEYSYQNRPDPRASKSKRFEDLLAGVMIRGLVFNAEDLNSAAGYQNKRTFFDVVSSVFILPTVRKFLPEPEPLSQVEDKPLQIQTTQEGSARVFQRELYLYWSYIRDHQPALTMRNELAKQALKEINGILLVKSEIKTGKTELDYPRLRFLRSMLDALNLTREETGGQISALENKFFDLSPAERVKRTFEAWRDAQAYTDLLMLPQDFRPRGTALYPLFPAKTAEVRARKFVVEQIHKLKPVGWTRLQKLVGQVYEQNYEFFLLRRPASSGYYGYALPNPYDSSNNELMLTFPGLYREEEGWEKVEANLIRGIVMGPLYWMGLVDLGWSGKEEDPPEGFQLTPLGAWLLGLGPQPEIPVEGGRVIVQPNLQIMALDPIQDSVLATLDRFAERMSAERAVEYRLTRASVYAGQLTGWDAARIKSTLEQNSGVALPANVARTLEEWQAQHERIVIHPKVTLMHGNAKLIEQLEKEMKGAITGRPMPDVALVKNHQFIPKIADRLRTWEAWPVINLKPVAQSNSVQVTESGEVRFINRLPSLYLHGHLAAFAERDQDAYRITPASVQRAVRNGMTAPEILRRVETVNVGGVPEKLARSIRAWAKHYGSASLTPVVLLQMSDESALKELLADEEVGKLMKRFTPHQAGTYATVQPENVAKLRQLLIERGVDLKDNTNG